MANLSNKKKKFIQSNCNKLSIEELARKTGLKTGVIRSLIADFAAEKPGKVKHPPQTKEDVNNFRDNRSGYLLGALVIFLITFSIYIPALTNGFVWDDFTYVVENTTIHSLTSTSLSKMLASFHAGNWHPLTWISHALDYGFWGSDPFGHHLSNILIHAFNTLLVFFLSIRLIGLVKGVPANSSGTKPSATVIAAGVTALLFGIHPLHVESVAWVAERKDLLCALFFLLSILCYLSFVPSVIQKSRRIWYSLCFVCAMLSLLSKPMAVTLPLILLLLDVYPLKRISFPTGKTDNCLSVVLEKAPFFALSIVSSIITLLAQSSGGALRNLEKFPLDIRLSNALKSLVFYLQKMIFPINLTPYYPFPPQIHWLNLVYLLSALLVLAITGLCLWKAKQGNYFWASVWGYYVVTLLPVLGIIQVGGQTAADRYTYLPSVSIFLIVGAGTLWLLEQNTFARHRIRSAAIFLVFICVFILLGQITRRQITIWINSETLWEHVIQAFPFPTSGPMAHNNLGTAYYKNGELDNAIAEYKRALAIKPDYENALNNLGVAYSKKGLIEKAIDQHTRALAINPNSIGTLVNLGAAYDSKGELDNAIAAYKKALELAPNYARVHNNLAVVYFRKGDYKSAIFHCDKVVAIRGKANQTLLELLKPYRTKDLQSKPMN